MARARRKTAPRSDGVTDPAGAAPAVDGPTLRVVEPLEPEETPVSADSENSEQAEVVTFGAWLQVARERQRLSLDDVAHLTKIRRAILEALERDARGELPEKVFVLGYVRSYAAAVGLDGEEALRRFNAQWLDDDDENGLGLDAAKRQRSWFWLPPALATAGAVAAIWYIVHL